MANGMQGLLSLMVLVSLLFPQSGLSKSTQTPGPEPGTWQGSGGGIKIYLEGSRILDWDAGGKISLHRKGGSPIKLDLKAAPQSTDGAEALGLDVEETDLGGSGSAKTYLKGKKQPKGRPLDPTKVGSQPGAKDQGKVTQNKVMGIPITQTKYANGARQLRFDWGKTQEEVYFDNRGTLVWVEISRSSGGTQWTLKQYGDGSFSRNYQRSSGEVEWIYDALSGNYRLRLANPSGQEIAELVCSPTCSLES